MEKRKEKWISDSLRRRMGRYSVIEKGVGGRVLFCFFTGRERVRKKKVGVEARKKKRRLSLQNPLKPLFLLPVKQPQNTRPPEGSSTRADVEISATTHTAYAHARTNMQVKLSKPHGVREIRTKSGCDSHF